MTECPLPFDILTIDMLFATKGNFFQSLIWKSLTRRRKVAVCTILDGTWRQPSQFWYLSEILTVHRDASKHFSKTSWWYRIKQVGVTGPNTKGRHVLNNRIACVYINNQPAVNFLFAVSLFLFVCITRIGLGTKTNRYLMLFLGNKTGLDL